MLSSFNRKFYALVDGPDFGFEKNNLLKNAFDIEFEYQVVNDLERNIDGALINLKPREKYVILLSGNGCLSECNVGKELVFVTSLLKSYYASDRKRRIMFNYLFKDNEVPLKNMEPNVDDVKNPEGMSFIPLVDVYVTQKVVSNKKGFPGWKLILEEI